uniref:Solute carrier family 22 member 16 n=1 Tax=Magallana gigas TaxID=29159 RepID=K1PNQ9_MAGGI
METDLKIMNEDKVDEKRELDEDYVYGRWGSYQTLQFAFLLFHLWQAGFQLLIGVFIAYRPGFECAAPTNVNHSLYNESNYVIYEKCQIKLYNNDTNGLELKSVQGCTNGYKYLLDKESTIVTEFDLICDKSSLAELIQTLVMAGQLVGAAFASSLSDRLGRKTVHLCSNLMILILGISVAFAPNYTTLAIMKFILGVFQQGIVMSGSEHDVNVYKACSTERVLAKIIFCRVQDESLRWLIANGKTNEVDKILHKVAKWNKLNYGELKKNVTRKIKLSKTKKPDVEESLLENVDKSLTVEKYSILTILQNKSVLLITMLMFGRRTATIFFHTITGSSLALATLLNYFSGGNETLKMLSIIATFAGKMSVTGSFSVLFLFTPELYPTNLRNVGIGMCSTFSRIGAMISPFAGLLALHIPWAPGTIFASMCFIVTVIALYLPETRGMDLLQTLDEVKVWYAEHSGFRLKKGRTKNKLESEIEKVYKKESKR